MSAAELEMNWAQLHNTI